MLSGSHHKQSETGYTLIDLLVVISGVVPGIWLGSYFHGAWRTPMVYVLSFAFGIAFWCFLFLWLMPLINRGRKMHSHQNDDDRPNAA